MLKDKINAIIAKESDKPSKKRIENIVVFVIILIITVIAINTIWSGDKKEETTQKSNSDTSKKLAQEEMETSGDVTTQDTMEKKLEEILSNIDGVGKVKVLITYSESSEVVAMYNENSKNSQVEEKDSRRWYKNYNTNRYCKRHNL